MNANIGEIADKWKTVRATLIPKVAAIMLRFTDDRFREQGWKDQVLTPWARRKNNRDPGRSILIKSGALRRGNHVVNETDHSVTIGNDLPYAKPLNDGAHGNITVKAHTRKRLARTTINTNSTTKSGKPRKATALQVIGDIQVKSFTRRMNLPARKYMGNSGALTGEVRDLITSEVKSVFK